MLNIVNRTSYSIRVNIFKDECFKMLNCLQKKYHKKAGRINIALLTRRAMKVLHKKFLQQDKVTDVLSFPENSNNIIEGDIAVCPAYIRQTAVRENSDSAVYFAEAVLHGMLHLFGVDHDYTAASLKAVYKLQAALLKQANIKRSIFDV
ncbi:MAG TPA: rRNA maturation RNase YbeY [Spirochaetota bacterium]|nr:rRNA maturation RNase YbeY [Spirochaetota bacterium]